ncbi:hypothetical protein I4F81_012528 [Pyropia yezoensis]|uniref:Uncharacterized protein n=1 Tax=Pyropia yezoensis TaxID=2788 RepID=A0ACC3CJR1_PYRYE|nr:hypothetical protein I4F81_012528 [Neopyropia yezoensis]
MEPAGAIPQQPHDARTRDNATGKGDWCTFGRTTAATAVPQTQTTGRSRRQRPQQSHPAQSGHAAVLIWWQSYADSDAGLPQRRPHWDGRWRRRYGRDAAATAAGTTKSGEYTAAAASVMPRHGGSSEMRRAAAGSLSRRHHDIQRGEHGARGVGKAAPRRQQRDGEGGRGVAVASPPRHTAGRTRRPRRR